MRRLPLPTRPDTPPPARTAFTLVELVVVIAIIAILVALLVPTLIGVIATVSTAEVSTEISNLESGLTQFHAKYGFYPPSTITLQEAGDPPGGPSNWDSASRAAIRRMFSKFDFSKPREINGNTTSGESIELNGSQCLVFFLGGLYEDGAMIGFSKNPLDPLNRDGTNREGPYTEFDVERLLIDSTNNMPVYLDPLFEDAATNNPYLYVNADDYTLTTAYHTPGGTFYKPQSYQIISPGADGSYGRLNTSTTTVPYDFAYNLTYDADKKSALTGNRGAEQDNITNFHSGELAPQ